MWSFDLNKVYSDLRCLAESDDYYKVHLKRMEQSASFLNTHLESLWMRCGKRPLNVLELAGPTKFGMILSQCCPNIRLRGTHETELRGEWSGFLGDAKFDVLICMEIIEHLRDLESSSREVFESSGIRAMLSECARRLCDRSSRLFISTPNGSSHRVLKNFLYRASPFMYNLHVREMSFLELCNNLSACGLCAHVEAYVNSWEPVEKSTQRALQALEAIGFDASRREDNLFVLAGLR